MSALVDTSTPVLILGLQGHFGMSVARSLGRMGVDVYGVHHDLTAPALGTRYLRQVFQWKVDARAPGESLRYLQSLRQRIEGAPILLASEEEGAVFIDENSDDLAEGFRIPRCPPGLVSALTSKHELRGLCEQHGIAAPATLCVPRSSAELAAFADGTTFPVVLKALVQWARYPRLQTRIARDRDELLTIYERLQVGESPNVLLQRYIAGTDATWVFGGYFDERSEPLAAFTGRKLRDWPPGSGQTTFGRSVDNPRIQAEASRFVKAVGYRGAVDMDFRYDPADGTCMLLDVNPRIGACFRLFEDVAELDTARVLYLDLTGQSRPAGRAVEGKTWMLEDLDVRACRRRLRDGALTRREWIRSLRSVDETAWWARDDLTVFRKGLVRWTRRRLEEAGRRGRGSR